VFNHFLGSGYYENIKIEWVNGAVPTAIFYDEKGANTGEAVLGSDMNVDELSKFLLEHGFTLKRPTLPEPVLTSELTIGDKHYQFFGPGKLFGEDAKKFASEQTWNGQQGRLVTYQCKAQEDQINSWIKSASQSDVEAWIGASDSGQEANWRWILANDETDVFWIDGADHNADPHYFNWRPYEPNNADKKEHCATTIVGGGWNDVNCENAAQLIVEFGPNSSPECDPVVTKTEQVEL